MSIYLNFVKFLEISRNCLAALNDPLGDACHRNHFWVLPYEPPSGSA